MSSETSKEATATFSYKVEGIADSIKVGSKVSVPRNRDDWMINLALDAGREVAKKHNTGLDTILITLDSISLSENGIMDRAGAKIMEQEETTFFSMFTIKGATILIGKVDTSARLLFSLMFIALATFFPLMIFFSENPILSAIELRAISMTMIICSIYTISIWIYAYLKIVTEE